MRCHHACHTADTDTAAAVAVIGLLVAYAVMFWLDAVRSQPFMRMDPDSFAPRVDSSLPESALIRLLLPLPANGLSPTGLNM